MCATVRNLLRPTQVAAYRNARTDQAERLHFAELDHFVFPWHGRKRKSTRREA